ncbi:RNA polymerase sigma-70 factor [uncultured Parabacteroides sp.]|uniref:RNA polymerase sigma-70 factor n=1 Tax=uncultured Parabacteroides sp. TaxID=512312 RepID=UPI0025F96EE8|nr:RNA polymerase sigma-70 factor [uncultured Parabacteroides sp.]
MDGDREYEYMKKLGQGDHKSFDALFMLYHPRVKNFLKGFIKDEEEACDMAQDIFFKVWTNRENISKVSSLKAYLYRMARNMIYDYYEHSLVKESYEKKQQMSSNEYIDLIEEDIYAKELSILIDIAIEQMPEQRRRIFKMSRKEGLSNDEISQQLEINKRTVENHITQALADLREALRGAVLLLF